MEMILAVKWTLSKWLNKYLKKLSLDRESNLDLRRNDMNGNNRAYMKLQFFFWKCGYRYESKNDPRS